MTRIDFDDETRMDAIQQAAERVLGITEPFAIAGDAPAAITILATALAMVVRGMDNPAIAARKAMIVFQAAMKP